jgi:hypothetical protein
MGAALSPNSLCRPWLTAIEAGFAAPLRGSRGDGLGCVALALAASPFAVHSE